LRIGNDTVKPKRSIVIAVAVASDAPAMPVPMTVLFWLLGCPSHKPPSLPVSPVRREVLVMQPDHAAVFPAFVYCVSRGYQYAHVVVHAEGPLEFLAIVVALSIAVLKNLSFEQAFDISAGVTHVNDENHLDWVKYRFQRSTY